MTSAVKNKTLLSSINKAFTRSGATTTTEEEALSRHAKESTSLKRDLHTLRTTFNTVDPYGQLIARKSTLSYLEQIRSTFKLLSPLTNLKQGKFGTIFAADCYRTGLGRRRIAIKAVFAKSKRDLPYFLERADSELKMHRPLRHPNIARFYSYLLLEQSTSRLPFAMFISMELLDVSVEDLLLLTPTRQLTFSDVKYFIEQITSAILYLHQSHHQVHHDIKPANIMIRRPAGIPLPAVLTSPLTVFKLVDLGLSRRYKQPPSPLASTTHRVGGTRHFWPPEHELLMHCRTSGRKSAAPYNPYLHDSYSFGVTLLLLIVSVARLELAIKCQTPFYLVWLDQAVRLCPMVVVCGHGGTYTVNGSRLIKFSRQMNAFNAIASLLQMDPRRRALLSESFIEMFRNL